MIKLRDKGRHRSSLTLLFFVRDWQSLQNLIWSDLTLSHSVRKIPVPLVLRPALGEKQTALREKQTGLSPAISLKASWSKSGPVTEDNQARPGQVRSSSPPTKTSKKTNTHKNK